ncbi:thiamine ABC transporter substrate binding subunit [Caviibacterium pharyngocola]|uniref:Thiamine-binding periplasmic protein n=1 Tax=Caviibacterium pharyngocola TaxID=28159 RepID=A0A2M8RX01_9PAST|nr:thiamine ABC transporter substrate binding subunit [Caviibacterium pharyngocola]PJG83419.1 thiamine ABC transporter substrate binding subunit [Caviibacterium pharyngocola]
MSKLKSSLFFTALFGFSAALSAQTLNVYTYDSFSAEWGAGPKIKAQFEANHPQCEVNYVPFDSAGTLFNRLRLEGKKTNADVVIGLDNSMLEEARRSGLFAEHSLDLTQLAVPNGWVDPIFVPYDFGQYAFIYDKDKLPNPPSSLKELVERQDLRVIYQDPRTSSVGRGLVIWLNAIYPAEQVTQAWQTLAKHTVTVGKGWSETYGAFLKGEADLVLSYNTSPLYHLLNEQKANYAAAEFSEPAVLQIETAAKLAQRDNACAAPFMQFLLEPQAQKEIALGNVMLPVISAEIEPHFDALKAKQAQKSVVDTTKISAQDLKSWIAVWQNGLTK